MSFTRAVFSGITITKRERKRERGIARAHEKEREIKREREREIKKESKKKKSDKRYAESVRVVHCSTICILIVLKN